MVDCKPEDDQGYVFRKLRRADWDFFKEELNSRLVACSGRRCTTCNLDQHADYLRETVVSPLRRASRSLSQKSPQ